MNLASIDARKALAGKYATKYTLDLPLLCALIHRESSWDPWAFRYEPLFFSHYVQPLVNNGTVHTMSEAMGRATSFGLMQILGQVAREHGFAGQFLTELCDPDVGMDYGCKKLQKCMVAHPHDVRGGLLSYNGGGALDYPDLVLQWLATYS